LFLYRFVGELIQEKRVRFDGCVNSSEFEKYGKMTKNATYAEAGRITKNEKYEERTGTSSLGMFLC